MALLTLVHLPDPRLKIVTKPVEVVDDTIRQLMNDMLETMYATDGAGLAATQVGLDLRVCVMDYNDTNTSEPLRMANPEILWTSDETVILQEGCLSVPGQHSTVKRFLSVKVRYLDEYNQWIERVVTGNLAHVTQHEIDHLNGKLFIDRLSPLKKNLLLQRYKKANRSRQVDKASSTT